MNQQEPSGTMRCPECLGELPAGGTAALLENGCVYCGADLTPDALSTR
ncbi:hypothetical protein HWV07_19250 [Natronomonas salina]|nr:hypothetical protein [Natronomonas salina]QLD91064.1 hypothetical protein HWV07_19250 [Natronomonas salina]